MWLSVSRAKKSSSCVLKQWSSYLLCPVDISFYVCGIGVTHFVLSKDVHNGCVVHGDMNPRQGGLCKVQGSTGRFRFRRLFSPMWSIVQVFLLHKYGSNSVSSGLF